MQIIALFRGKYFFLSNFYEATVYFQGLTYKSSEAAFQAMKCADKTQREEFANLSPSEAKKMGRRVKLCSNWEKDKYDIMTAICRAKFQQHPDLKAKLLETHDAVLQEGNTWGDTEWGICNGRGENKLGEILMLLREEFS